MALTPQQEELKKLVLEGKEPPMSEEDMAAVMQSIVPSESPAPQITPRPTSLATPIELNPKGPPKMEAYKAALLGGSQGLTAGLADDIAAALASTPQFAGERTMPSQSAMRAMAENDPAAVDRLLKANAPGAERHALMESQKQTLQDAAAQQPLAYYGGQVAGSLPAAMAVGPSVGGQIALGAAQGAGLAPEGEKLEGALLGGGGGALGALGGKAAGIVAKRLGAGFMDASDKALNAYLQLPAEDYIRFKNSGQLDEMLAVVRKNLSVAGGRAETARSIALEKEPIGQALGQLYEDVGGARPEMIQAHPLDAAGAHEAPIETLAVPQTATSNNLLGNVMLREAERQATEGSMKGRQMAAPWLKGYGNELIDQSKEYQKLTGNPQYKSLPELHEERKALDSLSFENSKHPGQPVNPSLGRSMARQAISDRLHSVVEEHAPERLDELKGLERNYENMSKSQDYLTQAADSIHGTGSAAGDAAAMLSGRGAKAGLSVGNSLLQPVREFGVAGAAKYGKPLGEALGGDKFQRAIRSLGGIQGPLQMKIQSILEEVSKSENPGLTDYMYREIDPDYNAHMLKAEEEEAQQSKER